MRKGSPGEFLRIAACLLALCLLMPRAWGAPARSEAPRLRALLVASDDFVTMPDTTPSSYNNAVSIRRALLRDVRGYARIRVSLNEALDAAGFAALAAEAFADARDGDMSLLYLSTHGLRFPGSEDFFALLSDGISETLLSGRDIRDALAGIPGTKVVILDACYSGAAIRKGMETPYAASPYADGDFKVLASAGGEEPSFLWSDGSGTVRGGSYFAQALAGGLTPLGAAPADMDRDGEVTLAELFAHQSLSYGASTPQAYPEGDPFVVFAYAPGRPQDAAPLLSGLVAEPRAISGPHDTVDVSYTLHESARIAYQLVYQRDGEWRFTAPQSISEDGVLPPGRRMARLRLQPRLSGLSGYVLLFIVSVVEDRAEPLASVLLTVRAAPLEEPPRLDAVPAFDPSQGEEASFILRHPGPVSITADVVDEGGARVMRLMTDVPSRPMHLADEGTPITWNGRLRDGQAAPPGTYRLAVTAFAGGETYRVESAEVALLPSVESAELP
ncbi:MAG TPA: caspase family protein [Candidatus Limnocylindria bacterium]|nr:caspase family protein [Candidatus Limnocylindria bacterium]